MALYTVRYPVSGQVLRLTGRLHVGNLRTGGVFAVGVIPERETDPVVMVDPRCVIEAGGRVVYRPEDFYEELDAAMRDWMDEQGRGPAREEGTSDGDGDRLAP